MREVCLRPLGKGSELGMETSSLKGLNHSESSFESSRKGCEWPRRGPWVDGTIIEVGLALVL